MFSIFKKKSQPHERKELELTAFVKGTVIRIEEVEDEVFSQKVLGDGIAIIPLTESIVAPADGIVSVVMERTKHAVGMTLTNGVEILIHVGIDTVTLEGEGFQLYVKPGDKVRKGDRLISFDAEFIKGKGFQTTTMLVLTNGEEITGVEFFTGIEAESDETVIVRF